MFQSCLNPQRVFNATLGKSIFVPCGRCEFCRDARRRNWARRLELESKTSPFVLFFTLTYSNSHLPKVYYDDDGYVTHFTYTKERRVYNRHTKETKRIVKTVTSHEYDNTDVFTRSLSPVGDPVVTRPPHFVRRRLNDKDKTPIFDDKNRFAFAYKKDFQNYIKRCRINLGRHFSDGSYTPDFSYFGVSEYGPDTYRPHFHGLLFFRSYPTNVDAVLRILSESWAKSPGNKIGREFEVVKKKDASSKYVSKYVCKDTTLPSVLLLPQFCTHSFKSISIPLGSESFDLSDIPSIFSKGTLLYDEQYYDKDTRAFVPYKCAYPRCAWERVFPKLLGRCRLTNADMRAVFNRIFQYRSGQPLPNLIKEFSRKYPLGFYENFLSDSAIDDHVKRYHGYDDPFDYPSLFDYDLLLDEKRSNGLSPSDCKRASFGRFFDRLISSDLDFFLFGIPQNRTFCKKILERFKQYDFLSNPVDYLDHYLRYETIKFTDSIRYVHEQYDEFPNIVDFSEIYYDFYETLYTNISLYDKEQITRLNLKLSAFGYTLHDFYGSDGVKLSFAEQINFNRDNYAYFSNLDVEKRKVAARYKSYINDEL